MKKLSLKTVQAHKNEEFQPEPVAFAEIFHVGVFIHQWHMVVILAFGVHCL